MDFPDDDDDFCPKSLEDYRQRYQLSGPSPANPSENPSKNPFPIKTNLRFDSFESAEKYIKNSASFYNETFSNFFARSIKNSGIKHEYNKKFTVYRAKFCCIHGQERDSRGENIKESKYFYINS